MSPSALILHLLEQGLLQAPNPEGLLAYCEKHLDEGMTGEALEKARKAGFEALVRASSFTREELFEGIKYPSLHPPRVLIRRPHPNKV